jgi:hypothetical protein
LEVQRRSPSSARRSSATDGSVVRTPRPLAQPRN